MRRIAVLISLTLASTGTTVLVAGPAGARPASSPDFFVVDTQFIEGAANEIVDSGGSFEGCTTVSDLSGGAGDLLVPEEQDAVGAGLLAPTGTVVIHYVAELMGAGGHKTKGYWFVVESTVPSISEGFGSVRGDSAACTLSPEASGCILDTFAGNTA